MGSISGNLTEFSTWIKYFMFAQSVERNSARPPHHLKMMRQKHSSLLIKVTYVSRALILQPFCQNSCISGITVAWFLYLFPLTLFPSLWIKTLVSYFTGWTPVSSQTTFFSRTFPSTFFLHLIQFLNVYISKYFQVFISIQMNKLSCSVLIFMSARAERQLSVIKKTDRQKNIIKLMPQW